MGGEMNVLEQMLSSIPQEVLIYTLIGAIIGCLFDALFGFRFIKLMIVLSALSSGYTFGTEELGIGVADIIPGFDISIVIGILCAVIFALLSLKFYKILVYILGGCLGVIFAIIIPSIIFSAAGLDAVGAIVGIVLAIIVAVPSAKLFYGKIFKPYYILCTSFGGMMGAAMCAVMIFTFDPSAIVAAMLVGLILGIPAAIYQFKTNSGRTIDDIF